MAQHSRCGNIYGKNIEKAQWEFFTGRFLKGYFRGPNTNLIANEMWLDGCRLTAAGQEEMAKLWFNSYLN